MKSIEFNGENKQTSYKLDTREWLQKYKKKNTSFKSVRQMKTLKCGRRKTSSDGK